MYYIHLPLSYYDHAGNLLVDDKARYSYDAEGLRHEMEENVKQV